MSSTQQLRIAPVAASIDNPDDWEGLANQITAGAGMPTAITPEMIIGMIGSAVPLLFAADAARDANLLRGTFSDSVIAQCMRNSGGLMDAQPTTAAVRLVGSRVVDGHPVVRTHLSIQTHAGGGTPTTQNQFWDLQFGGQVTVGQPNCPNCGAPIGTGELICGHCHTDVRSVIDVPIVVSRLDLY